MKKFGNFNIAALVIGFSFLYIPIILLILFSFNESRLVTVWGGFSTKWYGELMQNQGIKDGLIRFSVGIEETKDLIADIEQALQKVKQ